MRALWWSLPLGLLLAAVSAQAQTIRGTVVEDGTGVPIAGVAVEVVSPDGRRRLTAETDTLGVFFVVPARAGTYLIRLRHVAFRAIDEVRLDANPGEAVDIELRMGRTVIPLEPLVVNTRRRTRTTGFHERRERGTSGRFLTREDIERRPAINASELLRMMPGVDLVRSGSVGADNMIMMRGGTGRCLATVYVDGMHFRQIPDLGVDGMLSPEVLEGVEVYTGGATAPAPLHSRNGCGVVAFWTRTGTADGQRWSWRRFAIAAGGFTLLILLTR